MMSALYVLLRYQLWECSNVLPLRLSLLSKRSASTKGQVGGAGAAFFRVGRRQGLLACLT